MDGRIQRVGENDRATLSLRVDGQIIEAREGDTLLVALLSAGRHLRQSEFGDGHRAGFCLMGACQDCWVDTADGERLRACSVTVSEGMAIVTTGLEATWAESR